MGRGSIFRGNGFDSGPHKFHFFLEKASQKKNHDLCQKFFRKSKDVYLWIGYHYNNSTNQNACHRKFTRECKEPL